MRKNRPNSGYAGIFVPTRELFSNLRRNSPAIYEIERMIETDAIYLRTSHQPSPGNRRLAQPERPAFGKGRPQCGRSDRARTAHQPPARDQAGIVEDPQPPGRSLGLVGTLAPTTAAGLTHSEDTSRPSYEGAPFKLCLSGDFHVSARLAAQFTKFAAMACSTASMPSALGMPPCAISLLPPPRPPSFVIVSFISAPMSKGWPADCANTSDG